MEMVTRMFSLLSPKDPQFHQHKQDSEKMGKPGKLYSYVNSDPEGLKFFAVFFERLELMEMFLRNVVPIHNFRMIFLGNCVGIAVVKNPPKQMGPAPLALL